MVRVEGVHKFFGRVWAVRGVSFELVPGQIAGLLGPNGAGKTTTIRMIAGFLLPDSGRVVIDGRDTVDDPSAARRNLGYLPESTPLYPEMRVQDYLHYRGRLFGLWRRERTIAVEHVLERCWLRDMRKRRIGKLSKGYRQRVGLASAMLHSPKVLVLDEPTNGLDPSQIGETRRLVRELASDRTMLVSSHILPEVERLCDRVVIIAGGRVRADSGMSELVKTAEASPTYSVEVRCGATTNEDQVVRLWKGVPGAETVKRVGMDRAAEKLGWVKYSIASKAGAEDLREMLAISAQQAGALVRELHREAASLETVFTRLVDGEDMLSGREPAISTEAARSSGTTATSWRGAEGVPSSEAERFAKDLDEQLGLGSGARAAKFKGAGGGSAESGGSHSPGAEGRP
jgi:ABC-2 type transport system ATP-binding protein